MPSKLLTHWLPVIAWATLIFLFSANPDPYGLLPETIDKSWDTFIGTTMHFLEYAVLSLLLARALSKNQSLKRSHIYLTILLSILYSLSDEIHQLYVPGRTFQLLDLFVDFLGIQAGVFLFIKIKKKKYSPT